MIFEKLHTPTLSRDWLLKIFTRMKLRNFFYHHDNSDFSIPELVKDLGLSYTKERVTDDDHKFVFKTEDDPKGEYIFISPFERAHPELLNKVSDYLKSIRSSDDTITFDEFVVSHDVIENDFLGEAENNFIQACDESIQYFYNQYLKTPEDYIVFNQHGVSIDQDTSYIVPKDYHKGLMMMTVDNQLVGGTFYGTRYIYEQHRGKGYGVEMIIFSHDHPELKLLFPVYYSRSGYNSRKKAFEVIKKRAHTNRFNI